MQDSSPDFWINSHLDDCQICPKMLWMRYLVSVSHFAIASTVQTERDGQTNGRIAMPSTV